MAYASSRGLGLLQSDVYVEKGVSGGQEFNSRPEGSKLLASLKSGDIVIFPKLDRGFRNTRDALNVLHELKEKGVSVHSIDLGGDVTGNEPSSSPSCQPLLLLSVNGSLAVSVKSSR